MKLFKIFGFIILGIFADAQNKRFTYEYRFVPDSTNVSDIKTETMNLDISPSGSKFYSYTAYHSDSLMKADLEKQLASTGMINIRSDMKKGFVKYSVSKDYPEYETFLHNRILADSYKISEERKINWKISSEKQKIGEWVAQKAETHFGGRQWNAWFAPDIPIQDGPYKFHGLPGLIVKLEDETKSHSFTLQAIKKLDKIPDDIFSSKEISINTKQYNKLIREYENDPTKGLKQLQVGGITMKMIDGPNNHMKEQEERLKESFRKDNNRIELIKTIK